MMTDYIRRTDSVKIAEKYGLANGSVLGRHTGLADCIARDISELPAADVAEVVRCASCKYVRPTVNAHTGEQVGIWCCLHDILNVSPDDYCSRGEKKGVPE